ncbi:hypothetical protein C8Q77DRAFT_1216470 [Trametes polyzona]|nr:hypothetical protein C8Q77DRAFT_1216470 [Trametes polyzona]
MLSCRARCQHALRPLIHARRIVRREYSNKVRAFPFAVSKEQAIPWLSCNTALYTGSNAFETWIKYWLPFLDLQALQPTRVQAAYLPTWIVDAELRGTVWTKKQDDDDHFNKVRYVFEPLSDLSFMTPELLAAEVVPWSEDLRKHDGEDVLCVPYELTPLRIPEALRSLPMADGSISSLLRFEPPSVKEEFIAAYPVLIPVYLAQYNVKTPMNGKLMEMTITAFMEASRPVRLGRVGVETVPLFKQLLQTVGVPPPEIMIRGEHEELLTRFANVRSFLGQHVPVGHRAFVEKRINTVLSRNSRALCAYRDRYFGGAQEKAKGEVVDWSDPRIRPFDPAERQANLRWLKSNADLFFLTTMRDIYKARREAQADRDGGGGAGGPQARVARRVRARTAPARDS